MKHLLIFIALLTLGACTTNQTGDTGQDNTFADEGLTEPQTEVLGDQTQTTNPQTDTNTNTQTQPEEAPVAQDQVTELQITDTQEGQGDPVETGDTVVVHYTGTLLDGTKFDSSKDRGEPFSFTVGEGRVIQGWEEGLIGMKPGGTRELLIPSDMAYGERGVGTIPPNSPLKFEIELLEVK